MYPQFLCHWLDGLAADQKSLTLYLLTFVFFDAEYKMDIHEYCDIKQRVTTDENHLFPDGYNTFKGALYRYRIIQEFLHQLSPKVITLKRLLKIYYEHSKYPFSFLHCSVSHNNVFNSLSVAIDGVGANAERVREALIEEENKRMPKYKTLKLITIFTLKYYKAIPQYRNEVHMHVAALLFSKTDEDVDMNWNKITHFIRYLAVNAATIFGINGDGAEFGGDAVPTISKHSGIFKNFLT